MVDSMDAAIGRVIGTLNEEGLASNTIVIWISDNGGHQNDRGGGSNTPLRGQKGGAFDGGCACRG